MGVDLQVHEGSECAMDDMNYFGAKHRIVNPFCTSAVPLAAATICGPRIFV
jgi:hypothetical protein